MAILQGFPPSNTISPSVRITEKDLSFIPAAASFHRAALVGFASKGPVNIPTVVRTTRQLHTIFGFPHPEVGDPYLIYAAEQYLLISNELYILRVADTDAVSDERADTATVDVPSAGGQIIFIGDVAQGGGFSFPTDQFFKWRLNGIESSKTLVVLADDNRPSPLTGTSYTALQLVEDLNLQLDPGVDGIEFFVSGTGAASYIGLRTTFSFGPDAELELLSVSDSLYGPAFRTESVIGLGTGMTPASDTGENSFYPDDGYHAAGEWDFTGLSDLNLIVVLDGTENVLIDNVQQIIDLAALEGLDNSTADVVNAINDAVTNGDVPGGFYAVGGGVTTGPTVGGETVDLTGHANVASDNITIETMHVGEDARLLVKTTSTTAEIFGFDGLTQAGTSPSGVSGDAAIATYAKVNGDSNSLGTVTFTINAESAGIEGNETQVTFINDIRDGVFTVEVLNNGVQVEAWGNLTKDQSSRFYVETYLTLVSDFIRAVDNTATPAPPLDGTYTLAGGSDGIPSDPDKQDELIIGNDIGFTGLFAFSEPEQIDIDLIAVPGHPSTSVVTEMLRLCQNLRQDCMALIDPPFGLTVKEIIHWQNGAHPLNTTRFDSDFGALYWPWLKQRDNFNRVDVWVPPSGSVMAVYAQSDNLSAPWFAPAGATRGQVPGITDVYSRPTLSERDDMYGNRNAINPIVQFVDLEGFVVWGQKTLQRRPTALDRVNVRRLMFVIEKRIRSESRSLLFDPHDEQFRSRFVEIATRILREIQVGRGVNDFIIQADEELNTPDVIDRNEFRARIGIQPVRAVEFMFIEFSIHRTGSFSESTEF